MEHIKNNTLPIFLLCLFVSGCASSSSSSERQTLFQKRQEHIAQKQADLNNPDKVKNSVVVRRDDFKKVVSYIGPNGLEPPREIRLIAFRDERTQHILYQVYLGNRYYGDWHFYEEAYDSEGNKLELIKISRTVNSCKDKFYGCSFSENVGVNLSKDYLEKHINAGLHIKVSGTGGHAILKISGGYVKGFLSAVLE